VSAGATSLAGALNVEGKLLKLASDTDGGTSLNGAGIQIGFDILQPNNLLYNNGAWLSSIRMNLPSLGVTGASTLAAVTATTLSATGTSTLASVTATILSVTSSTLGNATATTLSSTGNTAINGVLRMGSTGTSTVAGYQGGTIYFNGPVGDSSDAYSGIQCKNYTNGTTSNEATELLLWQLNDPYVDAGPDRVRLYAGEIRFDTYIAAVSSGSQYTESTRMIIMPSGWVGIGETSPTAQLHISAGIGVNATVPSIALTNGVGFGASSKPQLSFGYQGTKTFNHYISSRHAGSGGNSIDFYTCNGVQNNTINDSVYGMTIQAGKVGVNKFNPTDQFHVSGNSSFEGLIACRGCRYTQGAAAVQYGNAINFWWTGSGLEAWVDNTRVSANVSDHRVKKDIISLGDGCLQKVLKSRPVQYSLKDNGVFKNDDKQQTGFIAHEVQAIIPDGANGVKDAKDSNGLDELQSLNVMPILSTLVKAVQELIARVQALEGLKMHRKGDIDLI
jgi:Chaperone of endosialidase